MGVEVPAHRLILASRCKPLQAALMDNATLEDMHSVLSISFQGSSTSNLGYLLVVGVSPLPFLILHYLCSDNLLMPWDRRIGTVFSEQFEHLGILPVQVKSELAILARIWKSVNSLALGSVVKRMRVSTLRGHCQQLFDQAQSDCSLVLRRDTRVDALAPDVALHLGDRVVYMYSVILRVRCPFFSAFIGDPEWTIHQRDHFGVVDVRLSHLEWKVMEFVLKFVGIGEENLFHLLGRCLHLFTSARNDLKLLSQTI